jgi:hypothetical protein
MPMMRAKLQIGSITVHPGSCEQLTMHAVAAKSYPADGSDEDNTFAKWSPSARFEITINNPALWGRFKIGQKLYVDFTEAE